MRRVGRVLALAVILGSLAAMPGQAQDSSSPVADGCKVFPVVKVVGLVNAGSVVSCVDYVHEVSSNTALFGVVFTATGPDTPAGLAITYTYAAQSAVGCSVAGMSQTATSGAFGSNAWAAVDITMTSNQCRAYFTLTVLALTTQIAQFKFSINTYVRSQASHVFLCDALGTVANTADPDAATCNDPQVNNYNFLCDAPGATPTAAPAATTTCNDLALAGTFTLSGIPDTQQEIQAIADALNAGLDVSICPPSAPCYQVLDGDIGVDVLDDTTNDGLLTVPTSMMSNSSINQTLVFPETLTVTNDNMDFWVPVMLWIVGIWASMRLSKLMAAGACTIGLGLALVQPGNVPLQILALAILGVVLWLEAFAREKIYARFFRPSPHFPDQEPE